MRVLRIRHEGQDVWATLASPHEARLWTHAPWYGGSETERIIPLDKRALLAPVTPSKIVCVGRNYAAHAKELGHELPQAPLLFLKPPSALLEPGGVVRLPPESTRVEYEGELGVVIGKTIRRVDVTQAAAAIFGITCANDVTARDLQRKDVQFTRGKGFDTFCPVGPFVDTDPGALSQLEIETRIHGELRQHGRVIDMVWSVSELISYVSTVMTLEPGDLVLTGTPAGVGPLAPGDRVEISIRDMMTLEHGVAAEPPFKS